MPSPGPLTLSLTSLAQAGPERLASLINAAFYRYPIMTGDRTSPEGLHEEVATGEMLLIERDQALVACAMVRPARDMAPDSDFPVDALYFGLAAVQPAEMGGGLGTRLVAEAEDLARRRGFRRVVLTTVQEFGLVDFYGRLGYGVTSYDDYEAGHWDISVPHRHCAMEKLL